MNKLTSRFSNLIKGTLSGFDRMVFKGFILPLMSSSQAMSFLLSRKILNKDYKKWMMDQTSAIIENAEKYSNDNCKSGIHYLSSWKLRKEELAHQYQKSQGINEGLIGIWSCLETGSSYRAVYSKNSGYPQLENYQTRCKHLYFYFDDANFGFMNIRFQTWFPYNIQVCLNGREWLRRSLEKQDIDFVAKGNKFLHIHDYKEAQRLLDEQLDARFIDLLNGFLPKVFPMMSDILGPHLSYYWTLWQSEWASDLIFESPEHLHPIMDSLLRHAHITGTSSRVLRYLDRPLTKADKPYASIKDDVITRISDFNDGLRLRHWAGKNSVKIYNEQNVMRIETTINDPGKFKVYHNIQGESSEEAKKLLPLRKGVMDIPLRAKTSQYVNNRFSDDLASLHEKTPAGDIIKEITHHVVKEGKRHRALDPTGKDLELLQAINDPAFAISGMTNKMVRQIMKNDSFAKGKNEKQLSAKVSRNFKLLRVHGIIRKMPKQNRYQLTDKGKQLVNLIESFLAASTAKKGTGKLKLSHN